MNFIKTSFLSGLSTAISLIARLISTKIVAVYLGTNGMFLMGQLKDFLRLSNTISSFGIENGIIKYTSEFEKQEVELKDIIGTSFKINFFSALIVSVLILIFRDNIADFLTDTSVKTKLTLTVRATIVTWMLTWLGATPVSPRPMGGCPRKR